MHLLIRADLYLAPLLLLPSASLASCPGPSSASGAAHIMPKPFDPAASPITFVKFDADAKRDVDELYRQRTLCGWGEEDVEKWRVQVRAGDKGLFWIFPSPGFKDKFPLPDAEKRVLVPGPDMPSPDPGFRPLGHISLDWTDYRDDESLVSRAEGRCTLATFFILGSQQGRGLGNLAMDMLEYLASTPPISAKTITLNTIWGENWTNPEWHREKGMDYDPAKPGRVNQQWYASRGYVAYKVEPRYPWTNPKTGEESVLEAVFMRKDLTAPQ
ncbi:hypothetical protein T439DRAFT_320399 [Meredithblackwellia eburnea MCA 4105]